MKKFRHRDINKLAQSHTNSESWALRIQTWESNSRVCAPKHKVLNRTFVSSRVSELLILPQRFRHKCQSQDSWLSKMELHAISTYTHPSLYRTKSSVAGNRKCCSENKSSVLKLQPSSSLLLDVILQGRLGQFTSLSVLCQPHKLGDEGGAVKGKMFYCPHFAKAGFKPKQVSHPQRSESNAHSIPLHPPSKFPTAVGVLYPNGEKATCLLRNMQSRHWTARERVMGDRYMPGLWVSLRIGWSHILNFQGINNSPSYY